MDPLFSFEFTLTQRDYNDFGRVFAKYNLPLLFLLLLSLISLGINSYYVFFCRYPTVLLTVVGAAYYCGWLFGANCLGRRLMRGFNPHNAPERLVFYDEQYCLDLPTMHAVYGYAEILRLFEAENVLLISRRGTAPLIIPKSVLSDGETERLRAFLTEKTGKPWHISRANLPLRIVLTVCVGIWSGVLLAVATFI